MWAMFKARNYEFFRDKAAFGWNFLFPFLIIAGFGIIFGGRDYSGFKVGVFPSPTEEVVLADTNLSQKFIETKHLEFVWFGWIHRRGSTGCLNRRPRARLSSASFKPDSYLMGQDTVKGSKWKVVRYATLTGFFLAFWP